MSCSTARQLDLLGNGRTWVHRIDSRVKILISFFFVGCVSSFPKYEIGGILPFLIFPVLFGVCGGVPCRLVVKVIIMASPFAVMVGLFNPVFDTAKVLEVHGFVITGGWLSFASIILRFILSMAMLLVLTATTSWQGLMNGLRGLHAPQVFVTQLNFLYRYLFVLSEEADRVGHARSLREPKRHLPHLRTAGKMVASLLWRTWERAERVYYCLKTRGFEGDWPRRSPSRIVFADVMIGIAGIGLCLALRVFPLAAELGARLM